MFIINIMRPVCARTTNTTTLVDLRQMPVEDWDAIPHPTVCDLVAISITSTPYGIMVFSGARIFSTHKIVNDNDSDSELLNKLEDNLINHISSCVTKEKKEKKQEFSIYIINDVTSFINRHLC